MKLITIFFIFLSTLFLFGCEQNEDNENNTDNVGTNENNEINEDNVGTNEDNEDNVYEVANPDDLTINEDKVNIYYFYGDGCPACAQQNKIWERLLNNPDYSDKINLLKFEVWGNKYNSIFMGKVASYVDTNINGVPTTFIGDNMFVGVNEDDIVEQIEICIQESCEDVIYNGVIK
ncbi:hypothetical protein [Candidatus Vampirococcus lugosii]|uniref:Thioredoxin domain-containing protein n=1 Tax=Candidatus Vampirococcus lugosii TaxID=2789015 RepID=A0ABS5QL81_9BACT|nr:hypothetical protein [Candidatus Vampirococcus lugosii]MBS8121476.1 hypothetical protein [Candidatus Vampirococcus lugosii]